MRWVSLVLIAVLAVATAIRVHELGSRGVTHIEMYAPNIPLPEDISDPPPRLTLFTTFTGSLWEPHPPAWYLLYWPWTRLLGTTPEALRLPSVVFGVLSIWLTWTLAKRERSVVTASLAAAMMAANGLHVMWSQISRPVMLASMLGLASSLLLIRVVEGRGNRSTGALLLAVSLLGLSTDYYYWPLFGGQIVWVFLTSARERWTGGGLLRWQFLAVILGSPLITLAVAQSRTSYLGSDVLGTILQYVGFGFLFGSGESTVAVGRWLPASAVALGGLLLGFSLAGGKTSPPEALANDTSPPPTAVFWLVTAGATLAVVAVALMLAAKGMAPRSKLLVTAVAPLTLALTSSIAAVLLRRHAPRLDRPVALSTVLCIVPPGTVVALSLFVPFLDQKYFLLFTPFLSIVIAAGMVRAVKAVRGRQRWLVGATLAAWLVAAHAASLRFYGGIDAVIDYRGLASQLRSLLEEQDRIMVYKHYAMTPIFYYLPALSAHYVGRDYEAAVREAPQERFWVISLQDASLPDPAGIREAVAGCTLTQTLVARRIRAELYEGCSPHSNAVQATTKQS